MLDRTSCLGILIILFILGGVSAMAQPMAYIPNRDDGTVSVVDTGTNTVVATIDVGSEPNSAAVTPDGAKVYVSRGDADGKVAVIRASDNSLLTTIDVGANTSDVAVSPDGATAWATNFNSFSVSKIDVATDTVLDTIDLPIIGSSCNPSNILVTPDGEYVYVGSSVCQHVLRIQTSDDTVVGPNLEVGSMASMDITPDGSKIYLSIPAPTDGVQVIDIDGGGVPSLGTFLSFDGGTTEASPRGLAAHPDGSSVWVLTIAGEEPFNWNLVIIDTSDDDFVAFTNLQQFFNMGFTRDGASAYLITILGFAKEVAASIPIVIPTEQINLGDIPGTQSQYFIGPDTVLLSVSKTGNGDGTVTSTPAGIDCGSACTARFTTDSEVTLGASPDSFSTFTGWGGSCSGADPETTITVGGTPECTAEFTLMTATLTLNKEGNGTGTVTSSPAGIDCGPACDTDSADFNLNTEVTLTAAPNASDSLFEGWGGACASAGTDPSATVTVTEAVTCSAEFTIIQKTLTLNKEGNGAGTVTSSPEGIDCGTACSSDSADFDINSVIALTAVPDASDSHFTGWSGVCSSAGTDPVATVTLSDSATCSAGFSLNQYLVNVVINGTGSGRIRYSPGGALCPGDCSEPYNAHQTVTLTPLPDAGSMFLGWTGPDDCLDGRIEDLGSDITCTATFSPILDTEERANLSITKSASADTIDLGEELVYTITVSNAGPDTATGVTITDFLPSSLTFVSATPGCGNNGGVINCGFGDLPAGRTAAASIVVEPTEPGTITNSATANAGVVDPNYENNVSTVSTLVVGDTAASLVVTPSSENITTGPGGPVSISVDIDNPSGIPATVSTVQTNSIATGVVFTIDVPEGFELEGLSGNAGVCDANTHRCEIGDIPVGGIVTVLVDATAPRSAGLYELGYVVTDSGGQEFTGSTSVEVKADSDNNSGGNGSGGCALAPANTGAAGTLGIFAPFILLTLLIPFRRFAMKR